MSAQATHEMICVIVNVGYAEDVMSRRAKLGPKGEPFSTHVEQGGKRM